MGRFAGLFSALGLSLAVAACGGDRTGGPRGEPQAVVEAAPDRTLAAGAARFEAASPDEQRSGEVDFGAVPRSLPAGEGGAVQPELGHPSSVVDLVRGAVDTASYGGAAVRGVSTFRYETVINVERAVRETPPARRPAVEALARLLEAPAFYADLWVDGEGRLRRVQLPLEKTTERPHARSKAMPQLVTVDFFDFDAG